MCVQTIAYVMWITTWLASGFTYNEPINVPDGKGGEVVYEMVKQGDMHQCLTKPFEVPAGTRTAHYFCKVAEVNPL